MTANTRALTSFEALVNSYPAITIKFADVKEILALAKTNRFIHELFQRLFQREDIYTSIVANSYHFFTSSLGYTPSEIFTRLTLVPTNLRLGAVECKRLTVDSPIRCLKLAPNGTQFFTTHKDHTIRRYDLATMKGAVVGCDIGTEQLQITPNGKHVLVVLDNVVNILELKTGQVRTLIGHDFEIWCVKISLDGKHIYTGSDDGTIKYWDFETGECTQTMQQITDEDDILQISQDGKSAVSQLKEKSQLFFWNVDTSNYFIINYEPQLNEPLIVSEIYSGKFVYALGEQIRICDLEKKNFTTFGQSDLFAHLSGDDQGDDQRELREPETIVGMAPTPDLKRAILKYDTGACKIFNFETGEMLPLISLAPEDDSCLEISPCGETVILTNGNEINFLDFGLLPEERVTKVAESLLANADQRKSSHSIISMLSKLSLDVQKAIPGDDGKALAGNLTIYNAMQIALPSIQRCLERAIVQPNFAKKLVSRAIQRIEKLSPEIKNVVYRHFAQIRHGFPEVVFSNLDAALLEDKKITQHRIEAIALTIAEFKSKGFTTEDNRTEFKKD